MSEYDDGSEAYKGIALLTGIVAFIALWWYSVATYGWFLGGGLGWIPSFFLAIIVGALWPHLLLAAGALYLMARNG